MKQSTKQLLTTRFFGILLCACLLPSLFGPVQVTAESTADNVQSLVYQNDYTNMVYEDAQFRLWVDENTATFLLENRESGQWYASNPVDRQDDPIAKGEARVLLGSVLVMSYLNTETQQIYEVNNVIGSLNKGGFSIRRMKLGVEFRFHFPELDITVPLQIQIIKGALSVKVPLSKIEEKGENQVFRLSLVPYFGAGGTADTGYILIPDGCGGLIHFNNGKTYAGGYNEAVYGEDLSDVVDRQGAVREIIHMATFGIKSNNAAFLAVLNQGQAQGTIHAGVAGVDNSYNFAYSSYDLRKQGDYSFDEGYKGVRSFTVYQEDEPSLENMETLYYFPERPDYIGMAAAYREHLIQCGGVKASKKEQRPILTMIGAVMKTKNLIGIPYQKAEAVTTWEQAKSILTETVDVGNFDVRFTSWSKQEVRGTLLNEVTPIGVLGSHREMKSLQELAESCQVGLYLEINPWSYQKESFLFQKYFNAVKGISGTVSALHVYRRSTGYVDDRYLPSMLIRPNILLKNFGKIQNSLKKNEVYSLAIGGTNKLNYSDFSGEKLIERWETQALLKQGLETLGKERTLLLSNPNDTWFPCAGLITDVPTTHDKLQLIDEAVPFYQLALSGLIPLSSTPINLNHSPDEALYEALATGTAPQYIVGMHADGDLLSDTVLNYAIGADYASNKEKIQKGLQLYQEITNKLGYQLIDYRNLAGGVMCAEYEKGIFVVNIGDAVYQGTEYSLKPGEYRILEGGTVS